MHKHQFVHSVFIALQLPITGCGVNPARSFAPAVITNTWNEHWVRLSEGSWNRSEFVGSVCGACQGLRSVAVLCGSLKRPACHQPANSRRIFGRRFSPSENTSAVRRLARHVLFRLFQPLQSERDSDCSRFALKRVFRRLIHWFTTISC